MGREGWIYLLQRKLLTTSKTEYPREKMLDERLSHRNCVISITGANLDGVTG